jgi:hypothetical protein
MFAAARACLSTWCCRKGDCQVVCCPSSLLRLRPGDRAPLRQRERMACDINVRSSRTCNVAESCNPPEKVPTPSRDCRQRRPSLVPRSRDIAVHAMSRSISRLPSSPPPPPLPCVGDPDGSTLRERPTAKPAAAGSCTRCWAVLCVPCAAAAWRTRFARCCLARASRRLARRSRARTACSLRSCGETLRRSANVLSRRSNWLLPSPEPLGTKAANT